MNNEEMYYLMSTQEKCNRELKKVNPNSDEGIELRATLEEVNKQISLIKW